MNPFRIEGPAVISFSGGRTSGLMLRRILDAHDGALPPDVFVVFANTGKERGETLDFVRDCAVHWDVRIRWVERRGRRWDAEDPTGGGQGGEKSTTRPPAATGSHSLTLSPNGASRRTP